MPHNAALWAIVIKLSPVTLLFLVAVPAIGDARAETLVLENGVELTIQESPYNRRLPHSYYDQAMESIAQLHPGHEVVVGRRFGTLGETEYSLLGYKRSGESGTVEVGGIFVAGQASWRFDSRVPVDLFADSLVLILEAISKPPSNETTE